MSTGIVTVGRKQYASGLYWENSPSGRVSQAAKEAARQPGNKSDYYATRAGDKKGRVPQFGLAQAGEGVKSGMPSLAGCLANQQPGSWIGAFAFHEGTAVVIVRDDMIVPEGDLFFEDESEARDHLYEEIGVGGFQRIYAPEAWGIPSADTMPISLLLNNRTDVRLHAVAMSKSAKLAMVGGLAVVGIVLVVGWYIQDQRAQEEARRMERLAALKRMQAEASKLLPIEKKVEYPPPERKWEKEPHPLALLEACREAQKKIPIGVSGWRISRLNCTRGALSVSWLRMSGFTNPPPEGMVDPTGRGASSSIPLTNLPDRGPEMLVDPDVVTGLYLAQDWQGVLARMPDDPPPRPPKDHTGEWNPPPPPWVKRSFTFNIPVLPWSLPDYFEGLPGVMITSIAMSGDGTNTQSKWNIKGVIYENRR